MPNDNKDKNKEPKNPLLKGLRSLGNITRTTNSRVFGTETDTIDLLNKSLDNQIGELAIYSDSDKSVINSHMFKSRITNENLNDLVKNKKATIYDYIQNADVLNTVETLVGGENTKFAQILKDYEIVKRCIPQIHKVINTIKNNIISPDAMSESAIGVKFPAACDDADKHDIHDLIEKYELNKKLNDYVLDYLIASVRYETVIPYSAIPDMLAASVTQLNETVDNIEDMPINEAVEILQSSINHDTLLSKSSPVGAVINEAVTFKGENNNTNKDYEEDPTDYEVRNKNNFTINPNELTVAVNEAISNLEFVNGGFEYFKRAFLNETVARKTDLGSSNKSVKEVLDDLRKDSSTVHYYEDDKLDKLTKKKIKDIRKKVDFKGCHIENLNAARVIPFKLRDTVIGYYYVDTSPMVGNKTQNNALTTIMDKLNSSVYLKNDKENKAAEVEFSIIKKISEKLIEAIDARFINDNYDDMDIIYEFVRTNELWKSNKRVIFFHPDDVCEYKRSDGSIMKNCMYLAKLYILTMLSNILANVTRGTDRNVYYVKTGLTTDIEGHVNSAIRALKQNQIRYSDMGTINEVFNIVGSAVDAFMPVSADGEKPIEIETISGQNVDMNNDFLNSLLKSIVQSFGVPSSVIDDFENIDFARSITMSNLDMARSVLDAQKEIEKPLTKELRLIISYELPDFKLVDEVYATLTPPSIIVHEMNKERIASTLEMINSVSELIVGPENESLQDKRLRLFKLEYLRRNIPTLNWDAIDEINTTINQKSREELLNTELEIGDNESEAPEEQY